MKPKYNARVLIIALAVIPAGYFSAAAMAAATAAPAAGAKSAAPAAAAAPATAAPAAAPTARGTPEAPTAGNRSGTPENPTPARQPVNANQPGNGAAVNGATVNTNGNGTNTPVNGTSPQLAAHNRENTNDNRRNADRLNSGNGYLIPGYYGTNYWDNGYLNNQSQYYGQFQQNDYNNGNNGQQQTSDTPAPALYIPPTQAETPSMTAALRASPAYQQADLELRSAQAEYDAASQRVTDRLHQDSTYQHATENKNADASKLSNMKASDPTPTPEQAAPIAQAKLDAAKTASDIERKAVMNDPQTMAAKQKLDAAIVKRAAIRAQIDASLPKAAPVAR